MTATSRPLSRKPADSADATPARDRALLRQVALRPMTAIEQMYAYWGSDRA